MAKTIYDVAKHAGVGVGTVSRAINGSPNIRPETKRRVMRAIHELGFTPNPMAKNLAHKRTRVLAAIMPFYTGHFYHELLCGIQRALSHFKYDLLIYSIENPSKISEILNRILQEKRSDGVIAISFEIPDKYIQKFATAHLPLVQVDRAHEKLDCVFIENEEGAYAATRHLLDLGHNRIGMITGLKQSLPSQERYRGFVRAFREDGLEPDPSFFVSTDMFGNDPEILLNDGFNELTGFAAIEKLLERPDHFPTAMFLASDIQAIGAMKAARQHGLQIPADLSIIGFDDIELSSYLSLTTMHQPMRDIGRIAVDTLMSKIESKSVEIKHKILQSRLIDRGSTAAYSQEEHVATQVVA